MTLGKKLNRRPDIGFERERNVQADPRDVGQPATTEAAAPTAEQVGQLISDFQSLQLKTRTLKDATLQVVRPLDIPVPETAATIRDAVARQDPATADGSRITFDLYLRALESRKAVGEGLLNDPKLIEGLSGNPTVDGETVSFHRTSTLAGSDNVKAMLRAGSRFMLLKVLQMVILPDILVASNTVNVPSPTAGAGLSTAVGIAQALMQIVSSVSEQDSSDAWNALTQAQELQSQLFTPGALGPETQAGLDQIQEAIKTANAEDDWEKIRRFADHEAMRLAPRNDAYASWGVIPDIDDIERTLDGSLQDLERYSTKSADDVVGQFDSMGQALNRGTQMTSDLYDALLFRKDSLNDLLNSTAVFLSSGYGRDLLCCLVRGLGGIDLDLLKGLQLAMRMVASQQQFDMGGILNKQIDRANKDFEDLFIEPLLHSLSEMWTGVMPQINEWLQSPDWEMAFICTPLDELTKILLRWMEDTQDNLVGLLEKFWDGMKIKSVNLKIKLQAGIDLRYTGKFIKVLDLAIRALERGDLCKPKQGALLSPQEVSPIVQQVGSEPERFYNEQLGIIPDGEPVPEGSDPLRDFHGVKSVKTRNGSVVAPGTRTKVSEGQDIDQTCLQELTEASLPLFKKFGKFLDGREQQIGTPPNGTV